ncbi:hypothetical protein SAMN05216201_1333 [Pseudomonas linyingensis]|uniref:Uncharacterized protein n=1 Tax=Pseudomonas linyingensis TaxID=915471 RepID=A0A1H7D0A4_9PSED|nr:hypothetical protein [Pseudomonas linyingensis]SEJ92440.1 hypothetical protein SAMN05216201_1333 [Pseudomonas linyingensis]
MLELRALAIRVTMRQVVADEVDLYAAYEDLVLCLDMDIEAPPFKIWEPLEAMPLQELIEHIERQVELIIASFCAVLETAKLGLINAAEHGEVGPDMNALDMKSMFETGALGECLASSSH